MLYDSIERLPYYWMFCFVEDQQTCAIMCLFVAWESAIKQIENRMHISLLIKIAFLGNW